MKHQRETIELAAARVREAWGNVLQEIGWSLVAYGIEVRRRGRYVIDALEEEPYRIRILYSLEIAELDPTERMLAWTYLQGLAVEIEPEEPWRIYQGVAAGLQGEMEPLSEYGVAVPPMTSLTASYSDEVRYLWNGILMDLKLLAGRD